MQMQEIFYEFFVRGEFDDPARLGQIKGAFVHYWPMVLNPDGSIALRGELGNPRPLRTEDVLPAPIAEQINTAALATVGALQADLEAARRVVEQLQTTISELQATVTALRAQQAPPEAPASAAA